MRANLRRIFTVASLAIVPVMVACGEDDGTTPPPQLASPTGVEVQALGPTSVKVTWSAVTGATSYEIERADGASGGTFAAAGASATTSADVTGLTTGATYRFRITAVAGTNRSVPSNPSAAITTPAAGPKIATLTSDITSNRTFHADTTYVLSGFIKVTNGSTLTIQPGTKIVGDFDIPGSSLFILRGSKIHAEGTETAPIVFTSERPAGQRQPGDWGGLIIIGNGIVNRTGETQIEGTGTPANINPAQFYNGGTDNDDNSGILRYVRVEFAGYPTAPNEELNSVTMAAVGRGTTIDHVQVLQGLDDSFEWFGGAVNSKYLVSYEAGDDHFDMSEGHVGRHQFLVAFQSIRPDARPGLAGGVATDPQLVENDGCHSGNCANTTAYPNGWGSEPFTIPVFANFTLVGAPNGVWDTPGGNHGMMIRRGSGGLYVNGVITRTLKEAISFRDAATNERYTEGNLRFRNIYTSGNPAVFQPASGSRFTVDLAENALEAGTVLAADLFTTFPAGNNANATVGATAASFDWRPVAGSPIATGGLTDFSVLPAQLADAAAGDGSPNSVVTATSYRGAADPAGPQWWAGWTNYARN